MGYFFFTQKSQSTTLELEPFIVNATLITPLLGDTTELPVLSVGATLIAPAVYVGSVDTILDLPVIEAVATLLMPSVYTGSDAIAWWYYLNMLREGD
jgi:hypothetical protein